jgi:hypothetical protein
MRDWSVLVTGHQSAYITQLGGEKKKMRPHVRKWNTQKH